MRLASNTVPLLLCGGFFTAALAGLPAQSQEPQRDEYGAPVDSQAERDQYGEVRQTVARISDIAGTASYARGDDPDNWQAADRNVPVTLGDRLYTGKRSRVELQVQGGNFVRIGSNTDLAVLNLNDDTKQFAVKAGVGSFQIRQLDENDVFEVDTPNSAVTIERPGDYRVDVDADGNTRVSVLEGQASVASGGGSVSLGRGDAMRIDGIDSPRYDVAGIRRADGWDRWVGERQGRISGSHSAQYVSTDVVGVADLDEAGRWDNIPEYGRVWSPTAVAVDWAPYRAGHWIWQDPWGWTWVSSEPWGWAPYHYGRWVTWSSRWFWVPVAPRAQFVTYSPALVAFVGGGPGGSTTVAVGGFVGWFPLAPRDPFLPWWGRRATNVSVNVTNVTYVNRTYVTVVNQNTFVSGGIVTNNFVRDKVVLRDVAAAPVVRGVLQVVPTRESLRVAARPGLPRGMAPPASIVARSVVARVAPPPAPPSFQQKLTVIQENRGAPVAAAAAAEISVRNRGKAQAITAVRPVTADSGRMTLAPQAPAPGQPARPSASPARAAVPVAPVRGREMATTDRPVASAPVVAPRAPAAPAGQRPESRAPAPAPAMRESSPVPAMEGGRPARIERPTPRAANPAETAAPRDGQQNSQDRARVPPPASRPPVERPAVAPPPTVAAPPDRGRERPTPETQDRSNSRSQERVQSPPPAHPTVGRPAAPPERPTVERPPTQPPDRGNHRERERVEATPPPKNNQRPAPAVTPNRDRQAERPEKKPEKTRTPSDKERDRN
jgi:hypothetical protein